jgi:hypothetical protein
LQPRHPSRITSSGLGSHIIWSGCHQELFEITAAAAAAGATAGAACTDSHADIWWHVLQQQVRQGSQLAALLDVLQVLRDIK